MTDTGSKSFDCALVSLLDRYEGPIAGGEFFFLILSFILLIVIIEIIEIIEIIAHIVIISINVMIQFSRVVAIRRISYSV